jgi:two-component system, NtrC family, response regulator AtoC
MARVLVVDDESGVRFALEEVLREQGHEVKSADGVERALELWQDADVIITDLVMPGRSGLDLLRDVHAQDPQLPMIVLTARGSERVAVEAMKAGAYDYLTKPFDIAELSIAVERGAEARRLRTDARRLRAEQRLGAGIVGESRAIGQVIELVERVANKDVPVLIRGETGTGKELVGGLLHALSRRATGPLVRFNCAAIPADLAEAELFGHTRGAFTGASGQRSGFFAEADGGTLILDEVAELPISVQPKLLRALAEGEIQRVGSSRSEHVDVRIVACTHRDLAAEARAERFRADLYYRLAVLEIVVPPLRARREDIPLLVEAFVRRYRASFGLDDDVHLSPALIDELGRRDWPGNVRELENTVARLVALSRGGVIGPEALGTGGLDRPPPVLAETGGRRDSEQTLRDRVATFERDLIAQALERSAGNQSAAARDLGVSRVTLIDKMKRHGLLPPRG